MSGADNNQQQVSPAELNYSQDTSETVGNNLGAIRWVANGLQLVGYYMLIHNSFSTGLIIKGVSDLLIMVWAMKNKLWDVVGVTAIFCVFNFQRAAEIYQLQTVLLKLLLGGHS